MRKSVYKVLVALVLIAGVLGLLAACAQKPKAETAVAQDNLIDRIEKRGVLKVGLDIFVPWSFKDKDGNLVGFEVDVSKKLAEDMGVDVEFVPTEWSGIIPALLTGKFDVIIGGMGITTERALKINYSIPYEYSGMDCVVSYSSKIKNVTSLEQLNREDVVIAVRMGGTPTAAAKKFTPKAQLHQFDSDEAVIQDVLNGNADAAFSSSPKPAFWAADYKDKVYLPLKGELFTKEPACFVVPKGDPDAVFFFNAWIRDNEDWLRDKSHYWYGTKDWSYLLPE
jgi:polar amino acid transport system substrate-binding protein